MLLSSYLELLNVYISQLQANEKVLDNSQFY